MKELHILASLLQPNMPELENARSTFEQEWQSKDNDVVWFAVCSLFNQTVNLFYEKCKKSTMYFHFKAVCDNGNTANLKM